MLAAAPELTGFSTTCGTGAAAGFAGEAGGVVLQAVVVKPATSSSDIVVDVANLITHLLLCNWKMTNKPACMHAHRPAHHLLMSIEALGMPRRINMRLKFWRVKNQMRHGAGMKP